MSFQTDPRTREDLDRIADAVDRNRDWVINEAVSNYIELHEWQLQEIEKGIADSDAGRTLSHEEVCARVSMLDAKAREPKTSK